MLINLYNGKGTEEYRDNYAHVVTLLDERAKQYLINMNITSKRNSPIGSASLQEFFEAKIESIVGTVRDKL